MNTSKKGSVMELLSMSEYKAYRNEAPELEWHVHRPGHRYQGSNDFLDSWDCAFLFRSPPSRPPPFYTQELVLLQVDDGYRSERYKFLKEHWHGMLQIKGYYVVYSQPRVVAEFVTKHFWYLRI